MAAIRYADATWEGNLIDGAGTVSASSSNVFSQLPVSWAARTEQSGGKTSPEELIAAAHASCFAMAFSNELNKAGTPPQRLDVNAAVTFARVDGAFKVVSSALTVRGQVHGLDAAGFQNIAEAAKNGCPISKALAGNVELSVQATLES